MKRVCILCTCALVAGCNAHPPGDCEAANDPKRAAECLESNAAKSEREQLLACFPFKKAERMAGLWVVGLERSSFFENAQRYDRSLARRDEVWLYVAEADRRRARTDFRGAEWYRVELMGRRAKCDGLWGHMGMSPKAVIAERILSISG